MSTKRIKLLAAFAAVFAAAMLTFAGCKVGPNTAQDILDDNGLTARVIYYANDGTFNDNANIRSVFYQPDTPVLNILQQGFFPVDTSTNKYPRNIYVKNSGFILEGWEYAQLDDNNNPVFLDKDGSELHMHVFSETENVEIPVDEYKNPLTAFDNEAGELVFKSEKTLTAKSSGKAVDFKERIPDGANWYFVAKWVPDVRLNYVLVCDEIVKISVLGDDNKPVEVKEYKTGDVIYQASYGSSTSVKVDSYAPDTDNATFLQAYADEDCKTEVTNVAKPTDGEDNVVYVKYIPGKWTIVKTPADVMNMFATLGAAGKQFYLTQDIDCSNLAGGIAPNSTDCKAVIEGNGFTIKNLNAKQSNLGRDANVSLFGNITADAKIKNLKFENLNVWLETRNDITAKGLFLFCNDVKEGAVIEGVELKNSTFTFSDANRKSTVPNIPYSGSYSTANWMFGGLETDNAFMEKYGVTVNGYKMFYVTDTTNQTTEELLSVEAK